MREVPIFVQLMEMIEDNIISGVYSADDLVISTTQMCRLYNVNPVTAMRAITELGAEGILVKDRGIGMRVTTEAYGIVTAKRGKRFLDNVLNGVVAEAKKLGIDKQKLLAIIGQKFDSEEGT